MSSFKKMNGFAQWKHIMKKSRYTLRWVANEEFSTIEDLVIRHPSQRKDKPIAQLSREKNALGFVWSIKFYDRDLILMAPSRATLKNTCKLLVKAFLGAM